jgi:hypothetical protein
MHFREVKITFRLSHSERERFKQRVQKTKLSQEAYLRQLINGFIPTDAPPLDFHDVMRQLHYIGNNLNQIAQKAHAINLLDAKRYDENTALLKKAIVEIINGVMQPRKVP